ncbi:hypothetical protein [Spiroplasma endosymbiont of Apeira syringaria]|uniref:hypothetical protein n=1 Tax=Spiroplasma endosymbiont of Apeira syringaria TaxID=3066307 RepID=UPI0030D47865
MQDIAVQFEKHCWIHSVSLFPPQVHVGRSPNFITISITNKINLLIVRKNNTSTILSNFSFNTMWIIR